ncbi:MarR family transcriptional regulator [Marinicauda salina]|uniref:MarR family transcriptional regulator n=1 Tax=Marinicauda salina TaxID=2135793 RepID=A0A2U2BSU9_9PROT|nr:MarR family winged helix-turn-helix transcriptional regulator [Marinicauda salina]PWE17077.1 MarR family transcriptional regulator [Marinicauda salina]
MAKDAPDAAAGAGADEPALRLPDYLPYRLSVASNQVSRLIARAYQDRFGLSIWEWRVIAVLGAGEALTAQAICEATAMDKVSVSRAIRSLDDRGLVARTPQEADRRASDVSLTDAGRAVYAEIAPLALVYEQALLEGFSETEREMLDGLLTRLEERAASLASEGGPSDDPSGLSRRPPGSATAR